MGMWQGESGGNKRNFDALIAERISSSAFDLDGAESFNWTELRSPDMKQVLSYVYEYAVPSGRIPEPNTMLVLAAGALGVLALRRHKQGVTTND